MGDLRSEGAKHRRAVRAVGGMPRSWLLESTALACPDGKVGMLIKPPRDGKVGVQVPGEDGIRWVTVSDLQRVDESLLLMAALEAYGVTE